MKKKSITRNYIYNLTYQILTLLLPLITAPYISRVLGAENIGIYSFTLSISSYFILFGSLGISLYGQREIAYQQGKKKETSKIFWEITVLRWITMTFSMIFFYFTFIMKSNEYNIYYKILLLEILGNSLDISWFFQGLEEFKKTVIRNTIVKLISVICIFLFVKESVDLNKYFIIYVLSTFLGNLSLWMYLPKFVQKVKIKELNLFRHVKPTIMLFIPQVATQIYTVLDKTMIGVIVSNKAEVGYYEQAQKIVKLLMTLATSLGTVMMPRIAATFASGNHEKVREYMDKSFRFILLLAFPLMFGIISVSSSFVPIFYGNGYDKVVPLLCVISPIIVLIGLSNVTGTQYLLPTKKQNQYTLSVVVGASVNFILNLILIKYFASIGASIATVIAELAVTSIQFILVREEIKFIDVIKLSYKYAIGSLIMFMCSVTVGYFIKDNLASIILQVIVSCFVYFLILYILKDKMINEVVVRVKSKIRKEGK